MAVDDDIKSLLWLMNKIWIFCYTIIYNLKKEKGRNNKDGYE